MRINNNIMAMNTHRQYSINNSNISKSIEKLSSGYRINRAGDDAAGLAISEKMRAQIRGLQMASKNSQDAISLVQTAEGALQTSHDILQRMRELAVQSASDTNETTIDRNALEQEFQQLIEELNDQANKTRFNDQNVIDGTFQKEIKSLGATAGFAADKATVAAKTAAGTYNITAVATPAAEKLDTSTGVEPVVDFSKMNGAGSVSDAKLSLVNVTGATDGFGVEYDDTDSEFTSGTATLGADGYTVNMQFELADKDGNTISLNGSFVLDNATADQSVNIDLGNGSKFTVTVKKGATVDDVVADLNALLTTKAASAPEEDGSDYKVDFSGGNVFEITGWTGNTVKSEDINGNYALQVAYNDSDDLFEVTLTDQDGRTVAYTTVATTLADITDPATEYTVDFGGDYGTMTLKVNASAVDDSTDFETGLGAAATAWSSADASAANVVTFSNGSSGTVSTGAPVATFEITGPGGAETVEMKVGESSITTKSGITIDFGKKLTEADLADDTALTTFLGSLSGSVTIDATEGKAMVIQTGANEGDNLAINIDRMDAWSLGVDLSSIKDRESASKAITQVNDAINQVSTQRAALGALQNRLDYKIASLDISAENLQAAESRIRDLDMAKEMTEFTKNNILAQAATAMLAQANALPQGVLSLLQ